MRLMRPSVGFLALAVVVELLAWCAPTPTLTPAAPTSTPAVISECGWFGKGRAWVDENENKVWDAGEPPLANVPIWAAVIRGYASTGSSKQVTDADGWIALGFGPMACPVGEVVVYAGTPPGY